MNAYTGDGNVGPCYVPKTLTYEAKSCHSALLPAMGSILSCRCDA